MPDTEEIQDAPATEEPDNEPAGPEGEEPQGGEDALGDPGKKALDAMKDKWHRERDQRKALEQQIRELQAKPKEEGDQPDPEAIKREAQAEADRRAAERILKAEIKAAAAGKLADPLDALRLLDLSQFEVDADGNIDQDEISEAITGLLEKKPYLSAQGGKRFQGTADNGARKTAGPRQLTQDDVDDLMRRGKPEEVVKAKREGRLNDLLGITSR